MEQKVGKFAKVNRVVRCYFTNIYLLVGYKVYVMSIVNNVYALIRYKDYALIIPKDSLDMLDDEKHKA